MMTPLCDTEKMTILRAVIEKAEKDLGEGDVDQATECLAIARIMAYELPLPDDTGDK